MTLWPGCFNWNWCQVRSVNENAFSISLAIFVFLFACSCLLSLSQGPKFQLRDQLGFLCHGGGAERKQALGLNLKR